MLVLIDNYDSFTYNLFHFLGELGEEVVVKRNDELSAEQVMSMEPTGIVLSPGPCDPDRAGICLDMVSAAAGKIPLLGVCLGHQAIGQAFGGQVVRAPAPMHGKVSEVRHEGRGVFAKLPSPLAATRNHSHTLAPAAMPDCLEVTARSDDGVIMGVQHRELSVHGVQFHPESIASEHGKALLNNFLVLATRH